MRYDSKEHLLADMVAEHDALQSLLARIPRTRYGEGGVWGDGWSVTDLLAHLTEWHEMLLRWVREGEEGRVPRMPAPGYKWNETPRLNRDIQEKHQGRPFDDVMAEFSRTYTEILDFVRRLDEEEILEPGHRSWTGGNALTTYVGANTASHYRFARKVLRRWLRSEAERGATGSDPSRGEGERS